MNPLPLRAATHDDLFHADDVLVGALLRTLSPTSQIVRTRDPAVLAGMPLVFDVGGVCDPELGRFDHHLPNPPRRVDGTPLSSIGLLWTSLTPRLADALALPADVALAMAAEFEVQVVRVVDRIDCGDRSLGPAPEWYGALTCERPVWDEQPSDAAEARALFDAAYDRQTLVLSGLLLRLAAHVRLGDAVDDAVARFLSEVERLGRLAIRRNLAARQRAIPVIQALLREHGTSEAPLLLPNPALPWREALRAAAALAPASTPPIDHVVFWGLDGLWTVVAVAAEESGAVGALFPEAWRGRAGDALSTASGIADAVFCHDGRHLAKFRTEASARAAAALARGEALQRRKHTRE